MTFSRVRQTNTGVPQAGGILWQMLLNNVAVRRSWETLGVHKTLLQWIAVDGYSFVPNPWLPTYNIQLDMEDLATYPWAQELIVGLPGFFNEYTSRHSLPLMAEWAEKFATLDYPDNVKGFYFPVEIDPTWTTAIEDMRDIWPRLPRPLYISAYYGNNIDGEIAAQWLNELLPPDVTLLFQDGVGAFGFELSLARERVAQLEHHLGKDRVHVIAEVFKINPNWDGSDGTYFLKLNAEEYIARVSQYTRVNEDGRLWLFDGPNYISSELIQRVNRVVPVTTPKNLNATANEVGDIRMTWERTSDPDADVTGYTVKIRDTSGNTVIRTYETNSATPEAFYPIKDSIQDFGFPPSFIVFEVAERSKMFRSDFSPMYVGDLNTNADWVKMSVALCGGTYMNNFFTDFTDIANPGTTGGEGGRFTVAAYTTQLAIARAANIDVSQVGMFNLGQSGSYLSRSAALAMGSNQYWFDDVGSAPGPVLLACAARLGTARLTAMVWGGGDDHLAFQTFPARSEEFAVAARNALVGVFRYLRDHHAKNGQLKMWLHPHLRSFYGAAPNPQEMNGAGYALLRNALVNVVRNNSAVFRIGTWVPGSATYAGYWNENLNWLNPTPQTARAAAEQLGQTIGTDTSLLSAAPPWAVSNVIQNPRVSWAVNDIYVSWTPEVSSTGVFRVVNHRLDNLQPISDTIQVGANFLFTEAQQRAAYGFATGGVRISVQEWDQVNNVGGAVTVIEKTRNDLQAIFDNGSRGMWLDPSDPDTCFVDSSGYVRANVGDAVVMVRDKSGGGYDFLQPEPGKRPILRQDVTGKRYLEFNGVNQSLMTGKQFDFSYTQATCYVGLKFDGAAPDGIIAESNLNSDIERGSWGLVKRGGGLSMQSLGYFQATAMSPIPNGHCIVGGFGSINPAEVKLRVNKGLAANSNARQGPWPEYANSVISIGARMGLTRYQRMDLYQLVVFDGTASDFSIGITETQIQSVLPDFSVLEPLDATFTSSRNVAGDVFVQWVLGTPQPGASYVFEVLRDNDVVYSVTTPLLQATYPYENQVSIFGDPPPSNVRYRVRVVNGRTSRVVEDTLPFLGSPIELEVARTTWGDVLFKWKTTGDAHAGRHYEVMIKDPNNPAVNMRSITIAANTTFDGQFVTCDYVNALNVPDAVNTRGDQFYWDYLTWQVRCVETNFYSEEVGQNVPVNNNIAVKVVGCGINSLVGGYFNDLSDPLNPGGTGREGRRDLVAAQTFRHAMAVALGLRDIQVMPVMLVVGSSPINPMPYQEGFDLNNYWWDAPTGLPGPNLRYADQIVKTLNRKIDYFIESGPGETTGISYAPVGDRPAIIAAWKSSNVAMLNWMRANWGNPTLEIWFQGATTSWWGDPPPPTETNFVGTKLLRDAQIDMGKNTPGFKMGSYVPDSNTWEVFLNEMALGVGWVHYTVAEYHAAAEEMGRFMGLNQNQANNPPPWAADEQPTNLTAYKVPNGDIHITWGTTAPQFRVRIHNPADGSVLRDTNVSANGFTYTKAMQVADFGNEAGYVQVSVAQVNNGSTGPYADFVGSVYGSLLAPTGLGAAKAPNKDVLFHWDARSGVTHYYVRNYNVGDSSIISEGVVAGNQYNFTLAMQTAAYGYDVSFVSFEVLEYDNATGAVGLNTTWSGTADAAQTPTNGTATKDGSSNITLAWDALDGVSWQVQLINVGNGNVIRTRTVNTPQDTFTAAEQVAEYGYTVGFVQWNVVAIKANGAGSPAANFSASV